MGVEKAIKALCKRFLRFNDWYDSFIDYAAKKSNAYSTLAQSEQNLRLQLAGLEKKLQEQARIYEDSLRDSQKMISGITREKSQLELKIKSYELEIEGLRKQVELNEGGAALIEIDTKGIITGINSHVTDMLGYSITDLVGQPAKILGANQESTNCLCLIPTLGDSKIHYNGAHTTIAVKNKKGKKNTYGLQVDIVYNGGGSVFAGAQLILREIPFYRKLLVDIGKKVVNQTCPESLDEDYRRKELGGMVASLIMGSVDVIYLDFKTTKSITENSIGLLVDMSKRSKNHSKGLYIRNCPEQLKTTLLSGGFPESRLI